jgi:hypothetical protein
MMTATVRQILRTRLQQVPDLPPVQHEGRKFTRAADTYVEDELRGGTTVNQSTGTSVSRPLYLLTIHTPPTRISDEMDRVTDALLNAFEPGRTLIDADRTHQIEVTTLDAGALRVLPDDGWGYRRVTVGLSVIAFRTQLQTA